MISRYDIRDAIVLGYIKADKPIDFSLIDAAVDQVMVAIDQFLSDINYDHKKAPYGRSH